MRGPSPPLTPAEERLLSPAQREEGLRLACQVPYREGMEAEPVFPWVSPRAKEALSRGRLDRFPLHPLGEDKFPSLPAGEPFLGVAVDLGTTTLAASLLDLREGRELARAAAPNPQAVFGSDVMSRLAAALEKEKRQRLRELALEGVAALASSLGDPGKVRAGVVVGNTAMITLFLGLDPATLALAPYLPPRTSPLLASARELGLPFHPQAPVYLPPAVGGFVGSDALAGHFASRLGPAGEELPLLYLDVGTNGEVILALPGGTLAASAPAGPAFEGGGISAGMPAAPGAVAGVRWEKEELRLEVVGGGRVLGICGSGLLDLVAALRAAGALDAGGLFTLHRAPPPLASRFGEREGERFFRVAPGVELTQRDIRAFQLAKGAVAAAWRLLLEEAGVSPGELKRVLLSGAFGSYLREESALRVGLLPPVPPERVVPVGNAALEGAELLLLSREAREELEREAARFRHLSLASHPRFQEVFLEALELDPWPTRP